MAVLLLLGAPLLAQQQLQVVEGDGIRFGRSVSGIHDLDGDLIPDFIVGEERGSSTLRVYSGATGAVLRAAPYGVPFQYVTVVSCAGDVNADGYEDYMASEEEESFPSDSRLGHVAIWSGKDGSLVRIHRGSRSRDWFGAALAPAGDVNADGHGDILIGAPGTASVRPGMAYVYSGADGSLLYSYLGSGNPHVGDNFGASVAGTGDLDLDGHDDFAVGESGTVVNGLSYVGSVSVFSGRTGVLLRTLTGTTQNQNFGLAIAGVGDLDFDTIPDLAVTDQIGAITIYSGGTGTVIRVIQDSQPGGGFGPTLDGSGDFDGDGSNDLIVGEIVAFENGKYSGSATVYSGSDGGLLASFFGTGADYQFGRSVAFTGDMNGDGRDEVLIGATGAGPSGSAFLFAGGAAPLLLTCPAIRRFNGVDLDARVTRASPSTTVYLAATMSGLGATAFPQYQVDLALDQAQVIFSSTTNAAGEAGFTSRVPPLLYGRTVWLQAFEQGKVSNWLQRMVYMPWYWS